MEGDSNIPYAPAGDTPSGSTSHTHAAAGPAAGLPAAGPAAAAELEAHGNPILYQDSAATPANLSPSATFGSPQGGHAQHVSHRAVRASPTALTESLAPGADHS